MSKQFIILGIFLFPIFVFGQLRGKVYDTHTQKPIARVTIESKNSGMKESTDGEGRFYFANLNNGDSLIFSHVGYNMVTLKAGIEELIVYLDKSENIIEEIVLQTGYESLPKERATGSFTSIDKALLNRSTSSNLMERLEGVSNGLFVEKRNAAEGESHGTFPIVRGVATLEGNFTPLIVLDGFPYEGDIRNIDPSIVENVTILKDAAAASIWGAQAGNGVIVITTKTAGDSGDKHISFNSSYLISGKPDFTYGQNFIPSKDFIEMEYQLFNNNFYSPTNTRAFSPVVEDLWKEDFTLQELQDRYGNYDIRNDVSKYLYRRRSEQNYSLNFHQKAKDVTFNISVAYLKGAHQSVGTDNEKINYRARVLYQPIKKLDIDFSLQNTHIKENVNGITMSSMRPAGIYPYARLIDEQGNHLAIPQNYRMAYLEDMESKGLRDWMYRPLDELTDNSVMHKGTEINLLANATYHFNDKISFSTSFNYYTLIKGEKDLYNIDSYYVRNLMNRFTQTDGTTPIPEGATMRDFSSLQNSLSGRALLKFQHLFEDKHLVTGLLGAEIKEMKTETSAIGLYGYNDELLTYATRVDYITRFPTLPTGTAQVPILSPRLQHLTDRYISQYGNISYEYDGRFIVSSSARIDGSNLFGVTTNKKKVPLWSAGLAWNMHKEDFFTVDWINYLKLRYTHGVAGNLDRSTSALPTGRYGQDDLTDMRIVTISSPGNPQLRWEKIQTQNFGLDYSIKDGLINGSVEYFTKRGKDLIGNMPLDPTTGYYRGVNAYYYMVNYANVTTRGVDFEIHMKNNFHGVWWNSSLIYNYAKDVVTKYDYEGTGITNYYTTYYNSAPLKGKSVYGMYSNQWYGLDSETGDPLVLNNGELNTDYTTFVRNLRVDDLIYHGSQIPRHTASWRNLIGFNSFYVDFNITWKGDYYFRKESVQYNNLFNNWKMNKDFVERWQSPGDELYTTVPSMPSGLVSNRDVVYEHASVLVHKGDNIRLKDMKIGYTFSKLSKIKDLSVYCYANNIGILWKANKVNIDPDRPYVSIVEPTTYMMGVSLNL